VTYVISGRLLEYLQWEYVEKHCLYCLLNSI